MKKFNKSLFVRKKFASHMRIVAIIFVTISISILAQTNYSIFSPEISEAKSAQTFSFNFLDYRDPYDKTIEFINKNYYKSTDCEKFIDTVGHPTLLEVISRLDTLARLEPQKKYDNFSSIGVFIQKQLKKLIVVDTITNSPSSKMGVLPFDTILSVDSIDISRYEIDTIINLLRGDEKTKINITVKRGNDTLQFTTLREFVSIPSIHLRRLKNKNYYLKIYQFAKGVAQSIDSSLAEITDCKILVVDLRNNTGGLLDEVVLSAGLFVRKNKIIATAQGNMCTGSRKYYSKSGKFRKINLIILVNSETLNGGVLFASAIKCYGRALLCGNRTSGNCISSTLYPINDSLYLNLPTGILYNPQNQKFIDIGLMPDIMISTEKTVIYYNESSDFKSDKQLSYAINYAADVSKKIICIFIGQ
jgi:carboxyl-terminal processing protease